MELTARQWFERIADPDLRKKALDNLEKIQNEEFKNYKYKSVHDALNCPYSFSWNKTTEGTALWSRIHSEEIHLLLLPTNPQQTTPEWQPTVGEMVEVGSEENGWYKRKFLAKVGVWFMVEGISPTPFPRPDAYRKCRPIEKTFVIDSNEKYSGFNEVVRPAMKWLAENCHPHMKIVIESNSAELLEGQKVINTDEYLVD